MSVLLFLLDTLFFALIAACLLRAWMNTRRIRMTQQPGPFVMALTNWLVGPLRRVLPRRLAQHDMDMGSLLAGLGQCQQAAMDLSDDINRRHFSHADRDNRSLVT